jgi:hypothetical protein
MTVKYPGKLGKLRQYSSPPGPLASDERRQQWISDQRSEWMEILDALFDFYAIERGNWMCRAIRLAQNRKLPRQVDSFKLEFPPE